MGQKGGCFVGCNDIAGGICVRGVGDGEEGRGCGGGGLLGEQIVGILRGDAVLLVVEEYQTCPPVIE